MTTLSYDGTFPGLLSSIFEAYRLRIKVLDIVPEDELQQSLFDAPVFVPTNNDWANRVKAGIKGKCSAETVSMLYRAFLSEAPGVSRLVFHFVKKAMESPLDISDNFADETVLQLAKLRKQVGRELHRMHAFVRFQKTKDDIFYAVIEPDFNVLPLLPSHFEKRYPAQHWLIYDAKRRYGIYYDMQKTEFITFADGGELGYRQLNGEVLADAEPNYQNLWKSYFDSVNIPERRNMKLHLQHVPRRYWKYLVEKGTARF